VPHRRVADPERLHALIDAMLLIGEEARLDEVLTRIVEAAARLVDARYAALGVLDEDKTSLRSFITCGVDDEVRRAIGAPPTGHGLLGKVIEDASVLRLEDLTRDPGSAGFPEGHPVMHRFLGVPVRVRSGEIFGNLYLCDPSDGSWFTEEDASVVEALGRAAGLVIAEARLRDQLAVMTLHEERSRLARDLHDTVIQRLFAVGLSLQALDDEGMSEHARERIHVAVDDLDATVREIRTTIFEISRDKGMGGAGLRARLLALVDEVSSRLGLPVAVEFNGPIDAAIGPECANQVVHATRELLTNVVRHANAAQASLQLSVAAGTASLVVADDGIGPGELASRGRGLVNLSERAATVGGRCVIEPRDGGGTLVTWTATWLR